MNEQGPELIPVDMVDNFYVVSENWLTADLPFPSVSARTKLIKRGYTTRAGTVHIGGRARRAVILMPPDSDDQFFAQLDEVVTSRNEPTIAHVAHGDIERYWKELYRRFGKSEGVLPEQCIDIVASFVEPKLSLALTGEHVTWGHLRDTKYLLVSGAPGAGKTTLLRQWILWHSDNSRRGEEIVLPIYLSLRDFRLEDSIEVALRREAEASGASWLARDLRSHAHHGTLAIGFDGIDEIPIEDRPNALAKIAAFTNSYPNCRYMMTTRPGISVDLDVGLHRATLLPLDSARIRQFVYYHLNNHSSWKNFAARIEAEPALEGISRNPLALSFIIARYLRHEISPSLTGEIVSTVADIFVDSWDAARGIVRTKEKMLPPSMKRKLLAWVAERRYAKVALEMPLLPTFENSPAADVVLRALSEHTGLLSADKSGTWNFEHQIFEDYFRANMWVSALSSKAGDFRGLFRRPLSTDRSNLVGFVAFMSSDADVQIREVIRKLHSPEISTAVRLTEVISQGLPLNRSTLDDYAALITQILDNGFSDMRISSSEHQSNISFCFTTALTNLTDISASELGSFVGALHRSRGGLGAETIRAAISKLERPYAKVIDGLLSKDGKLQLERTIDRMTWWVEEILPHIPEGTQQKKTKQSSWALH